MTSPLKASFTKYHTALMAKLGTMFAAKTDLPGEATTASSGLLSANDKAKLDSLGALTLAYDEQGGKSYISLVEEGE